MGPARAWRAPAHPQGCLITMSALEDLAAKLNMDPLDFLLKNIQLAAPAQDTFHRADTYRDELLIAADLIGWKANWRPRGKNGDGAVNRGLGLSFHTWGGRGHNTNFGPTLAPHPPAHFNHATLNL